MIKLVALDIDGTTLLPNHTVSPAVVKAINQAQDLGVKVIFASGRWHNAMKEFYPIINASGLQINNNGSTIVSTTGEVFHRVPMALDETFKLIAELDSLKIPYGVCSEMDMFSTKYSKEIDEVYDFFCITKNTMTDLPYIAKLTVNNKHTPKYNTIGFFNTLVQKYPLFNFTGAQEGHLEIWPKTTNKGIALERVASHYGFTLAECLAVGDGSNDVDMLKMAGFSVAMGNGCEAAKQGAKVVGPKNTEDGVAWAINKFVLKN